jgi:hypothetical protein
MTAFGGEGLWLRCALHAHTTESDGRVSPEELVRHYEDAGFDVLAITDHWVRTEAASTQRLLVIPSVELGGARDPHVLGIGVTEAPQELRGRPLDLREAVAWVLAHGGVPFVAHPYWSGLRADELERCEGAVGLEVYNASCQLELGRGLSAVHWDEVLAAGRGLYGIAADDAHDPGLDSRLAWVWARCAGRSSEALLVSLRSGRFYSSTGPRLHDVSVDGDCVEVRCSGAESVTLLAGGRRGSRVNADRLAYRYTRGEVVEAGAEGEILAARLERPAKAAYGRVEVADRRGRTAWTNPLWIDPERPS